LINNHLSSASDERIDRIEASEWDFWVVARDAAAAYHLELSMGWLFALHSLAGWGLGWMDI